MGVRDVGWLAVRFALGVPFVWSGFGLAMTNCEPDRGLTLASWVVAGVLAAAPRAVISRDPSGAARGLAAGAVGLGAVGVLGAAIASVAPWLFWFAPVAGVASYLYAVEGAWPRGASRAVWVALLGVGVAAAAVTAVIGGGRPTRSLPRCGAPHA